MKLAVVLLSAMFSVTVFSQNAALHFDVASVRASPPLPTGGARVVAGTVVGERWISQNAPLIDILRSVYPDFRLRGLIVAPDWVQRTRFDIDARAVETPSRTEMIQMMKQLLSERFVL